MKANDTATGHDTLTPFLASIKTYSSHSVAIKMAAFFAGMPTSDMTKMVVVAPADGSADDPRLETAEATLQGKHTEQ